MKKFNILFILIIIRFKNIYFYNNFIINKKISLLLYLLDILNFSENGKAEKFLF